MTHSFLRLALAAALCLMPLAVHAAAAHVHGAATLAVAIHRNWIAALDDGTAIKKALARQPGIQILRTVDIVSTAIIQGALSVEEADAMKMVWETEHRFRLKFGSFADIVYRDRRP